jgi:hypothetical protein
MAAARSGRRSWTQLLPFFRVATLDDGTTRRWFSATLRTW